MPESVIVTGATGFVGSHLAYRLLHDGCHVIAIARPSKTESAHERVADALCRAAARPSLDGAGARLQVVDGDITLENLGMPKDKLQQIAASTDAIWHCAASLSFTEDERDEIFRMNVDGARRVLDFAEQTRGRRLHHVSTAYVAGIRDAAAETDLDEGQKFRNPYEESKCRAEQLVVERHRRQSIAATVYRPSIVIGDSRTGRATHCHGVYAFIRGLWSAQERRRRKHPSDGPLHLPLRVPGIDHTTLNFVPIDYVVNGMVEISKREASDGNAFHLTNPAPTEHRVWLPNICRPLGVEGIRLVDPSSFVDQPINKLEALFQKQMAFYYMYLQGEPRFDCSRARAILEPAHIDCPRFTPEFIEKMIGWYVNYLKNGGADVS